MNNTRIVIGVEYNGSQFSGWQMQSHGERTVQDCVQQALTKVADHPISVICAGRTDTGVHACSQVVHFDTSADRQLKAWVQGANIYLPSDVSVLWARQVDDSFSARFSATLRSYRYIICNRNARPALLHGRVSWIYDALDVDAMHRSAQYLLGEHDYSSFRSSKCSAKHARRFMTSLSVKREQDFIYIDITANAFLHHMVRNIAGSLLQVGRGERPENWLSELLEHKDRTRAGPTATADGLYLVAVEYPPHYELPSKGQFPHFS